MDKLKKGDFVEIEYTGKFKLDNKIFDTTSEKIAKENKINNVKIKYGSVIVCVGEGYVIQGLDKKIENKECEKEYSFEIEAEDAFGKKNPQLIKTVSMSLFKKQKMNPYPGLQLTAGGMIGTVRSVNGGRVLVDFNHPLAGKDLIYEVKINKKITDKLKKVRSILTFEARFNEKICELKLNKEILEIILKIKIPKEITEKIEERIKKLVPEISKIKFSEEITT
jgi:FKBP-type peptidyl-prolyl cis-trans isomerase 2